MEEMLRFVHVVGAACFRNRRCASYASMRTAGQDAKTIAHVAGTVVIADALFTATAVDACSLSPAAGSPRLVGWPLSEGWIVLSLAFTCVTGLFWLPVVCDPASPAQSRPGRGTVPERRCRPAYFRLYRVWFVFGFPAFFSVAAIFCG